MSTIWERVQALKGETLETLSQKKRFDIVDVSQDRVFIAPHGSKNQQAIKRADIEAIVAFKKEGHEIIPRFVQEKLPKNWSASYITTIVEKITS